MYSIPIKLIAYFVAVKKGTDVDSQETSPNQLPLNRNNSEKISNLFLINTLIRLILYNLLDWVTFLIEGLPEFVIFSKAKENKSLYFLSKHLYNLDHILFRNMDDFHEGIYTCDQIFMQ